LSHSFEPSPSRTDRERALILPYSKIIPSDEQKCKGFDGNCRHYFSKGLLFLATIEIVGARATACPHDLFFKGLMGSMKKGKGR